MKQSKFAVTGGIGSGKSAFCAILREEGYPVYSCDKIYAELLKDAEYLKKLRAVFPDCFSEGTLDKGALARRVFANEEEREKLNRLAHPLIMERLFSLAKDDEIYFAEVPLLFEGGFESAFDGVIAIRRDKKTRLESVRARDGIGEQEILARMARQFDPSRYEEKDCLIIENDGSLSDLKEKATTAIQSLLHKTEKR